MPLAPFKESTHRSHDYRHLIQRWKRIARDAKCKLVEFARAGEFPLYVIETAGVAHEPDGLYISAGIHGDEPAATEALVRWAERHLGELAHHPRRPLPMMILPCLNPWGLTNNQRADEHGRDLNRLFDRTDVAPVGELRARLSGRRFALAVNLHEDYEAQGVYLYELSRRRPDLGGALIEAASKVLPIEMRGRIDGRPAKRGIMLRRANLERIPLHPEAIYLYLQHCDHVLTVETPSEFGLERRVGAHVRMLEVCARHVVKTRAG